MRQLKSKDTENQETQQIDNTINSEASTMSSFFDNYSSIKDFNPPTTTLQEIKWSDDLFSTTYVPKGKRARTQVDKAAKACKNILNWYFGATDSKHLKNNTLAVLYGMMINEDEYLIPDSLIGGIEIDIGNPVETALTKYHPDTSITILNDGQRSQDQLQMFKSDIEKWISDAEEGLANVDSRQDYINLVGFMMLTLLRLIIKDLSPVSKHIMTRIHDHYLNLFGKDYPLAGPVPPPNALCKEGIRTVFKHLESSSKEVLSIMVAARAMVSDGSRSRHGVLDASCLLTLKYTGMGAYSHCITAALKYSRTPYDSLTYVATKKNQPTCKGILDVLQNYESKEEKSFSWSRLFDDGAFPWLSGRKAPAFTYLMILLVNAGVDVEGVTLTIAEIEKPMIKAICNELILAFSGSATGDALTSKSRDIISKASSRSSGRPGPRSGTADDDDDKCSGTV